MIDPKKVTEIQKQIISMFAKCFEDCGEAKAYRLAEAAHEELAHIPTDKMGECFKRALQADRRTKFPTMEMVARQYKRDSVAPTGGYYDGNGSWIPEGTYYHVGSLPLCHFHKRTLDVLKRHNKELSTGEELLTEAERKYITEQKTKKFYPEKGKIQKHISEWTNWEKENNERELFKI